MFVYISGVKLVAGKAKMIQLTHRDPKAENSLYNKSVVVPVDCAVNYEKDVAPTVPAYSFTILKLKIK